MANFYQNFTTSDQLFSRKRSFASNIQWNPHTILTTEGSIDSKEFNSFLTTEPSVVWNDSLILSFMTFWEFAAIIELVLRRLKSTLKNSINNLNCHFLGFGIFRFSFLGFFFVHLEAEGSWVIVDLGWWRIMNDSCSLMIEVHEWWKSWMREDYG